MWGPLFKSHALQTSLEAGMLSGVPISVPASTVTMACISSNLAITTGAEKILSGQADIVVAGQQMIRIL